MPPARDQRSTLPRSLCAEVAPLWSGCELRSSIHLASLSSVTGDAMRTRLRGLLWTLAAVTLLAAPARAASLEELVSAVVRIKTYINPDGQTVQSLGRERDGSGIVIDEDGLILTIGYLMV